MFGAEVGGGILANVSGGGQERPDHRVVRNVLIPGLLEPTNQTSNIESAGLDKSYVVTEQPLNPEVGEIIGCFGARHQRVDHPGPFCLPTTANKLPNLFRRTKGAREIEGETAKKG